MAPELGGDAYFSFAAFWTELSGMGEKGFLCVAAVLYVLLYGTFSVGFLQN